MVFKFIVIFGSITVWFQIRFYEIFFTNLYTIL